MNKLPRLVIAWVGILIAFAAVYFSQTIWMIAPATFIIIAAHWIALDSEWPRGNQLIIGQGLLSLIGIVIYSLV